MRGLRVAILANRRGWHTAQLLRRFSERGHQPVLARYEAMVARLAGGGLTSGDEDLDAMDAIFARIIPAGSLEQVIYRVDALHRLEERGIPVVNSPRAIERTVDKFWTSATLEHAGVPTPETVVCERLEDALTAFRRMGDAVVKPLFGSMGRGLVRVSDEETAYRVLRAIVSIGGVCYLQRMIPHGGRDVRAFVVADRVLAAIERRSDGDWRTNLARGASAAPVRLPPEWEGIAVCAARAVAADYAGVDLVADADGRPLVLEVNGVPAWRGLQQATGIDVASSLVRHVEIRAGAA